MDKIVAFFLLSAIAAAASATQPERLVVGVFPYLTTRTLVNTYQPLRMHLEQSLAREVAVVTAPDLRQFYARSQRGDYDILVTPPHFARLHQLQSGLIPLFGYSNPTTGLLVARRDSGIKSAEDLRGREIAIAEPVALVAIMCSAWMGQHGMKSPRDYTFHVAGSHNSAVMSVVNRETAAAVVGASAFKQITEKFKSDVVVVTAVGEVMGLVVLANPRLGSGLAQIEQSLASFPSTPEGQQFIQTNGIGGFKPIERSELQKLDPYLPETTRWLKDIEQFRLPMP